MTLAKPPRFRETLLALANLRDDSPEVFLKKFKGDYAAEDLNRLSFTTAGGYRIYEYRDNLRQIWRSGRDARASLVSNLLSVWVAEANKRGPYHVTVLSRTTPATRETSVFVTPNYGILPLSLALGVSDLWQKMAICGNPECPNPYFLKGRETQRFCDRPACTAYGQREHKRNWWAEHGAEWKQEWERKAKSRHKRNRKKGKEL